MATKGTGSKATQASRYKTDKRWEINRKARLERTIRNQPTNEQAKLALKGMVYRRKTPGDNGWTATEIATAKLIKEFSGHFDRSYFNPDPKVSQVFLQKQGPYAAEVAKTKLSSGDKGFFSLMARCNMRKTS